MLVLLSALMEALMDQVFRPGLYLRRPELPFPAPTHNSHPQCNWHLQLRLLLDACGPMDSLPDPRGAAAT